MRTRERAVALLFGALATSCASNPTPAERRVSQEEAISSGKGAYAFVLYADKSSDGGELIAAPPGQLLLLTEGGNLVAVDWRRISELTLGVHDNNADALGLWGVLGSLSTLSHGVFLVFTLPVWLGASIGSTAQESHRGIFRCPADTPRCAPRAPDLDAGVPRGGRRVRALPAGPPARRGAGAAPRTRAGRRSARGRARRWRGRSAFPCRTINPVEERAQTGPHPPALTRRTSPAGPHPPDLTRRASGSATSPAERERLG